jgi:hypothetical protein
VPSDGRVGDEVCILNGGAVPFVLRKRDSDKGKLMYTFVGEAYIHGIMYGRRSIPNIIESRSLILYDNCTQGDKSHKTCKFRNQRQ